MKNLLLSATALALVIGSGALSAPHDHDHGGPHGGGNPAATPAAPAGGHSGPGGSHHEHGGNPLGAGGAMGGPHHNRTTPAITVTGTPRAHGSHNNGAANTAANPFGTGGTNRSGHAGGSHNNAFAAYRRAVNAPRHYHYRGSYRQPAGWHYQRWTLGAFLPSLYWSSSYWISDYNYYGLGYPPPGTVWVRYGDDALLIDRDSGEVIQVIYGIFY